MDIYRRNTKKYRKLGFYKFLSIYISITSVSVNRVPKMQYKR
nr:MAG TPA: hypothetical protein [Bacteriophage sp.]